MPKFRKVKWNGYSVLTYATEFDFFRLIPIVPYFWDSNINLDIVIEPPKKRSNDITAITYKWELLNLDEQIIKSDKDSYNFNRLFMNVRKHIKLGYLKPQQNYRLNIILTDVYGATSPSMTIVSLTIKDRDEIYTQLFLSIITIILGIIIGFMAMGC
jgi:hypothetical protein